MKSCADKFLRIILIFGLIGFFANVYADNLSPIGYWQTIDDHTHKPAGVMQIWQKNGVLYGTIRDIYLQDGNKPTDICKNCPNEFHDKPIIGMTVMWGLVQKADEWENGKIMDPKIGRVYDCKIKMSTDGDYLDVRGYIGISLLGRTQTWQRIENYQPIKN